jgi:hypothetical protein
MMSMIAITIRVWTQLPVFGKFELMFRPKKPSSHRITRTTIIIQSIEPMKFLLFYMIISFIGSHWVAVDQVVVDLTVEPNGQSE